MPAGYNQIGQVWRYSYLQDDDTGGSVPSGTILYDNIPLRIEPATPTMALLEQGLETVKLYRTIIGYDAKDIKENDQVLVVSPEDSWYLNKYFRIVSVQHASMRPGDPRSHVVIIMRRLEEAHALQY